MRWSSEQSKVIAKDEREGSQVEYDHFSQYGSHFEFHWDSQGAN